MSGVIVVVGLLLQSTEEINTCHAIYSCPKYYLVLLTHRVRGAGNIVPIGSMSQMCSKSVLKTEILQTGCLYDHCQSH